MVKIDFLLSQRMGTVESIIFRLVLNGMREMDKIYSLLYIFSDDVIITAMRNLVNNQLISADLNERTLELSESVRAVIQACKSEKDLYIPDKLRDYLKENTITDRRLKESILSYLLPGIRLNNLALWLDFAIKQGD